MTATQYNVTVDRAQWARVKVKLMTEEDRKALMRELIIHDQQGALEVTGEIARSLHGQAVYRRELHNHT